MFKCWVDGPENLYNDCDPETCNNQGDFQDCEFWKELLSSGTKVLHKEINNCSDCPHLVDTGREDAYCNNDMKVIDVPLYNAIPVWCQLDDKENKE